MIVINTNTKSFQVEGQGTDVFNETVLILDKILEKIFPNNVRNDFCKSLIMFLNTKIKDMPILSEDEKVILKRINKDFEAIRRGVNSKVLQLWSDDTGYIGMDIFDEELFSWIQPRRRI